MNDLNFEGLIQLLIKLKECELKSEHPTDAAKRILEFIQYDQLESKLAEALKELEKFKEAANKSICVYCGAITKKDGKAILAHMIECEKRPEFRLTKLSVELAEDRDRWRGIAEKAREALQTIVDDWDWEDQDCQECGGTKTAREALALFEEGKHE